MNAEVGKPRGHLFRILSVFVYLILIFCISMYEVMQWNSHAIFAASFRLNIIKFFRIDVISNKTGVIPLISRRPTITFYAERSFANSMFLGMQYTPILRLVTDKFCTECTLIVISCYRESHRVNVSLFFGELSLNNNNNHTTSRVSAAIGAHRESLQQNWPYAELCCQDIRALVLFRGYVPAAANFMGPMSTIGTIVPIVCTYCTTDDCR